MEILKQRKDEETQNNILLKCPHPNCPVDSLHVNEHMEHLHKEHSDKERPYKCSFCVFESKFICSFRNHFKECFKKTQYKVSKSTRHMQTEHEAPLTDDNSNLKCIFCKFQARHKIQLMNHMEDRHDSNEDHRCPECDFESNNKCRFKYHMATKHDNTNKNYNCSECMFVGSSKLSLKRHERRHKQGGNKKCPSCPFETIDGLALKNHITTIHGISEHVYLCEKCDYSTQLKKCLATHFNMHHNKATATLECSVSGCSYKTKSKYQLNTHTRINHAEKITYFHCEICSYKSEYAARVKRHMEDRHDVGIEIHVCQVCPYKSTSVRRFRYHLQSKHDYFEEKKCSKCSFTAKSRTALTRHMMAMHGLYSCGLCWYRTDSRQALLKHKTEHTNFSVIKNTEISENSVDLEIDLQVEEVRKTISRENRLAVSNVRNGHQVIMEDHDRINANPIVLVENEVVRVTEVAEKASEISFDNQAAENQITSFEIQRVNIGNQATENDTDTDKLQEKNVKKQVVDNNADVCRNKKVNTKLQLIENENNADKFVTLGTNNDDENYNCSECTFVGSSSFSLKRHQRKQKQCENNCPNCLFQTTYSLGLKSHIKKINNDSKQTFYCDKCNFSTLVKKYLLTHFNMKHSEKIKTLECSVVGCSYKTKSKYSLNTHERINHSEKLTYYHCEICSYKSKYAEIVKRHVEDRHGNKILVCQFCPYKSTSTRRFTYHVQEKHDYSEEKTCSECSFVTKSQLTLRRHMRTMHGLYSCGLCWYRTDNRRDLSNHKMEHTNLSIIANTEVAENSVKLNNDTNVEVNENNSEEDGFEDSVVRDEPQVIVADYNIVDKTNMIHVSLGNEIVWATDIVDKPSNANIENQAIENQIDTCEDEMINVGDKIIENICNTDKTQKVNVENRTTEKSVDTHKTKGTNTDQQATKAGADETVIPVTTTNDHVSNVLGSNGLKGTNLHECTVCGYKTDNLMRLEVHSQERHDVNSKPYKCPECGFETMTKREFKHHQDAEHDPGDKNYSCLKCTFVGKSIYSLKTHVRKHEQTKNQQCPSCPFQTIYSLALKSHIAGIHGVCKDCYQCDKCDFSTSVKKYLLTHFNMKHNEEIATLKCPVVGCSYKTKSKYSLHSHKRINHSTKITYYHCEICNFESKYAERVRGHMEDRHDAGAEIHICQFCPYKSTSKRRFTYHLQAKHDYSEEKKCSKCSFVTRSQTGLRRHMRTTHGLYGCGLCWYRTDSRQDLSKHKMEHTNLSVIENTNIAESSIDWNNEAEVNGNNCEENGLEEPVIRNEYQVSSIDKSNIICNNSIGDEMAWTTEIIDKSPNVDIANQAKENQIDTCEDEMVNFRFRAVENVSNTIEMQKVNVANQTGENIIDLCGTRINTRHQAIEMAILTSTDENRSNSLNLNNQGGANLHKCTSCNYKTDNLTRLEVHIQERHNANSKLYKCPYCDFQSNSKLEFKHHIDAKHDNSDKRYNCSGCAFVGSSRYALKRHQRRHNRSNESKKCPSCPFRTTDRLALKNHVATIHADDSKQVYFCNKCDYSTHVKKYLMKHFDVRHGETVAKCSEIGCSFETVSKHRLNIHSRTHHREKTIFYHCEICNFKSKSTSQVKKHMEDCHDAGNQIHSCSFCPYKSTSTRRFRYHLQAKHDHYEEEKCSNCSFTTKSRIESRRHMRTMHGLYSCGLCWYRTDNRQDLLKHKKEHTNHSIIDNTEVVTNSGHSNSDTNTEIKKTNLERKCEKSDGATKQLRMEDPNTSIENKTVRATEITENSLKINIENRGTENLVGSPKTQTVSVENRSIENVPNPNGQEGANLHECAFCNYETDNLARLEIHIQERHDISSKPYKCPECNFETKSKREFKYHQDAKHDAGDKSYSCSKCTFVGKSMHSLKRHARKHELAKNQKCPRCPFQTIYGLALKSHIAEIHGDCKQSYRCDKCDFSTAIRKYLLSHFNMKHNKEIKTLECSVVGCSYKTKSKYILSTHKRINHSEKITYYHCETCSFKSKYAAQVRKHMEDRHDASNEIHVCQFCPYKSTSTRRFAYHLQVKHDYYEEKKCSKCSFVTESQIALRRHMRTTHGLYGCGLCWYRTDSRQDLQKHKTEHTNLSIIENTETVSNSVNSNDTNSEDIKLNKMNNCERKECEKSNVRTELQMVCDEENRTVETNKNILTESRMSTYYFKNVNINSGDETASKNVENHSGLSKHLGSKSQGVLDAYKCLICEYETINVTKLDIHLRGRHCMTWTGPYKCLWCQFESKSTRGLNIHIQKKHNENSRKNRKVQLSSISNMTNNLKRKGVEFRCLHCPYETKDRDDLRTHSTQEHATEMLQLADSQISDEEFKIDISEDEVKVKLEHLNNEDCGGFVDSGISCLDLEISEKRIEQNVEIKEENEAEDDIEVTGGFDRYPAKGENLNLPKEENINTVNEYFKTENENQRSPASCRNLNLLKEENINTENEYFKTENENQKYPASCRNLNLSKEESINTEHEYFKTENENQRYPVSLRNLNLSKEENINTENEYFKSENKNQRYPVSCRNLNIPKEEKKNEYVKTETENNADNDETNSHYSSHEARENSDCNFECIHIKEESEVLNSKDKGDTVHETVPVTDALDCEVQSDLIQRSSIAGNIETQFIEKETSSKEDLLRRFIREKTRPKKDIDDIINQKNVNLIKSILLKNFSR